MVLNMSKYLSILILVLTVLILTCACVGAPTKSIKVGDRTYAVNNEEQLKFHFKIKGYLGDYSGIIPAKAYNIENKSNNINMWLDPKIVFSKYKKLTIMEFEDLTGEADSTINAKNITQVLTSNFATEPSIRKMYKQVTRSKNLPNDGLILKGAIVATLSGAIAAMWIEAELVDGKTGKTVGQFLCQETTGGTVLRAASTLPQLFGPIFSKYWKAAPGFDPKTMIQDKPVATK